MMQSGTPDITGRAWYLPILQVDPQKISSDENINTNIVVLRRSAQKFLHTIINSYASVPEYVLCSNGRPTSDRGKAEVIAPLVL